MRSDRAPPTCRPARVGTLALLLVSTLASCATPRQPGAAHSIFYEPQEIVVDAGQLDLAGKNDRELFVVGQAAYAAGDWKRAAAAFSRLADLHPDSPHHTAALFDAGLAYERLESWHLALGRFRALRTGFTGPDADEAAFREAGCLRRLGDLREARDILDRLAGRLDLPAAERVRALTQRGVVELEDGSPEVAERSFRLALATHGQAAERERLDDDPAAQAQFYLGEIYRRGFDTVHPDPSTSGSEQLAQELEQKAELLLSAQGHYLRTIRMGNPEWAVAAGSRIGEMYDALHASLLGAPLPPGLDEEQARAYREELRRWVRVVAEKAVAAYEQTLAAARRTGVDNPRFLPRLEEALDRMKRELLQD